MTDSLSQYCPNCETQANTIEELRAANERWVIAFNQAEERANGRIEALQADKAKLREAGYDALVALDSARAFILKKYGSKNPAREDAIAALTAALQETGQ